MRPLRQAPVVFASSAEESGRRTSLAHFEESENVTSDCWLVSHQDAMGVEGCSRGLWGLHLISLLSGFPL